MDNKILAKVGEFTVTESDVNEMIAKFMQSGQNLNNPQGREIVLEQLIANKLFLLDAKKNMYEYNAEFKAQLEKVKNDMLVNFAMSKALDSVKPATEDEIKAFISRHDKIIVKPTSLSSGHGIYIKNTAEITGADIKSYKAEKKLCHIAYNDTEKQVCEGGKRKT